MKLVPKVQGKTANEAVAKGAFGQGRPDQAPAGTPAIVQKLVKAIDKWKVIRKAYCIRDI